MAEIKVKVGVDNAQFNTGLAKIRQSVSSFKAGVMQSFAGFSLASLVSSGISSAISMVKELADEIGKIKDKAEQFGMSMRAWQNITNGIVENGGNTSNAIAFFDSLTKARAKAIEGNAKYLKSFTDLGISIEQLKSLNNEELFYAIANAVQLATDKQKAYYDTMVIGAGGAKELFNALSQGSDVLKEQAEAYGTYSDTTIYIIDEGAKIWGRFWTKVKAVLAWISAFIGVTLWIIWDLFVLAFNGIANIVKSCFAVIKGVVLGLVYTVGGLANAFIALGYAIVGNLKKAAEYGKASAESFKNAWKSATDDVGKDLRKVADDAYVKHENGLAKNYKKRDEILSGLFGGDTPKKGGDNKTSFNTDKFASEYEQEEKLLQALEKLEEKRRQHAFEQLDTVGKIWNLYDQLMNCQHKMNEETAEGVEASIKALEIEKQISQLKEKIAQEEEKLSNDIKNRQEQLADIQRQQAFDQLSTLGKILDLEKQIAQEKAKANNHTKDGLNASIKLVGLEKQLGDENEKMSAMRDKSNKAEDDYLFSRMSKSEKIQFLEAKAIDLKSKMNKSTEEGNQAIIDYYANQKELNSLIDSKDSIKKTPQVIATSLASIGGGGNVYKNTFSLAEKQLTESKKQTDYLKDIAENTESALEAQDDSIIMQ